MNDWLLLGVIAAAVMVPAIIISLIVFVRRYYNHWTTFVEADSSGHLLPLYRLRTARRKKDNIYVLKFFNKFIFNWSHQDKDFQPFTESKRTKSYFLFKDYKDNLHDFKLDYDSIKDVYRVKCIPTNIFSTQQSILHDLNTTYNEVNWFQKYGPWVIGGSLGVLLVFALMYWGYTVQNIADTAAGVTDRCFDGCLQMVRNGTMNLTAVQVT